MGQFCDGASVMRGKYNGVRTRILKESPQCLFNGKFDHVLNLGIMETCGSSFPRSSLWYTGEAFHIAKKRRNLANGIVLQSKFNTAMSI